MNKLTVKQSFVLAVAIGTLVAGVGPLAAAEPVTSASQSQAPLEILDQNSLEAVVAPIALYPDELLGIVLPGATFPLQIVQASRYLEDHQSDPTLEPSSQWDDTVVALLNYPEVIALLNENLDWTYTLGEAVINQQSDVIAAIERFRQRASAAGNLQSDDRKVVSQNNGTIEIRSADPRSVYVPYYEPAQIVYPQSTVVYHYYPNPYPVYYYPYSTRSHYYSSAFWGISSAFSIGWFTHRLHVNHYGYRSHPYYGHSFNRSLFRRLDANNHRINSRHYGNDNRYGDYWNPGNRQGQRLRHHRNDFGGRRFDGNRSPRNNEFARGVPGRNAGVPGANRGPLANTLERRGTRFDNQTRGHRSLSRNAAEQRDTPAQALINPRGTFPRETSNARTQTQAGASARANPRLRSAPAAQNSANRNANRATDNGANNIRRERSANRNTDAPTRNRADINGNSATDIGANNIRHERSVNRNTGAPTRNRADINRPERRSNTDRAARTDFNNATGAAGLSAAIRGARDARTNTDRAVRNSDNAVQRGQRQQAPTRQVDRPARSLSVGPRNDRAGAQAIQQGFRSQNGRQAGQDRRGDTARGSNRSARSERSNRGSFRDQR